MRCHAPRSPAGPAPVLQAKTDLSGAVGLARRAKAGPEPENAGRAAGPARFSFPRAPAQTELPPRLKAGIERLAGLAKDVVRVHRESLAPGTSGERPTPVTPLASLRPAMLREADAVEDVESPIPPRAIIPKDKDQAAARLGANCPGSLASTPSATFFEQPAMGDGKVEIATVLRSDGKPQTYLARAAAALRGRQRRQIVAPRGAPAKAADTNKCVPSASTLAWNVVSADAKDWRANVQSMTLSGTVHVAPWPSKPTSTVAPNTPNPVDGGNITKANFQSVIDDMADYHTLAPVGGAGPWHSTEASHAHEWAHWNTDWVADSILGAKGGNWSKANKAIDALRQPKAASAIAAEARTALKARVDARFVMFKNAAIDRWNAIPDKPGVPGSTGYIAGAAVLAKLIKTVRAYATGKGWLKAPAVPRAGHK